MRTLSAFFALGSLLHLITPAQAFAQEGLTPSEAYQQLEERGLVENLSIHPEAFLDQIEAGNAETVKLFLVVGINPDATDRHGRQSLLLAAERGHAEVVRVLVEAGADVSVRDRAGRTPLVVAAWREHDEVVQVLTEAASKKQ